MWEWPQTVHLLQYYTLIVHVGVATNSTRVDVLKWSQTVHVSASRKARTATPTIYSRVHGKVVTHSGVATNNTCASSAPRSG